MAIGSRWARSRRAVLCAALVSLIPSSTLDAANTKRVTLKNGETFDVALAKGDLVDNVCLGKHAGSVGAQMLPIVCRVIADDCKQNPGGDGCKAPLRALDERMTTQSSPSSASAESASPPRTFQGVWYRTSEKRGVLAAWLASGTLTVRTDAIIFESKKINVTIPTANIWDVVRMRLWKDSTHTWSVVAYDEGGLTKLVGFMDGGMFGHDDAAILTELRLAEARGRSEPTSVRRESTLDTGTEGRTDEGMVEMKHYSFKMPSNGSWRIETRGGWTEEAVLTKQLEPTSGGQVGHVQIKLVRNQILTQKLVKLSARENADYVRQDERKAMLKQGVARGLYQLHDVSMGEATISGKHFFFMDYTTETLTDVEPSSLYLLFPHERGNTSFLMVVYTAVIDKKTGAIDNSKPDLMSVLSSLELKGGN